MDPSQSVLVQFYAPWCPHCKRMTSTYNTIARKLIPINGATAVRLNADDNKDIMKKYNVKTLPTMMIFSKKNKTGTLYSIPDANQHLEMVEKVVQRLLQPESDETMEANAQALLVRVTQMQEEGRFAAATTEIQAARDLNVTEVWRNSIQPLSVALHEKEAQRLKEQASRMAGEGNFAPALDLLQKVVSVYSNTIVAKSEAVKNLLHNCEAMLAQTK